MGYLPSQVGLDPNSPSNDKEKTIEGDLFEAFVAAGAVSKANADDPKKSSLVRCARTDKGVHAAGNVISMKLIIEDEDIAQKINSNLSPQIRIWGIERTSKSFNAYALCDSRIYEYLIPTHCFLPPHPESFLGRSLLELADEAGDRKGYEMRQQEVASFWTDAGEAFFEPVLERLDPQTRSQALSIVLEGGNNRLEETRTATYEPGARVSQNCIPDFEYSPIRSVAASTEKVDRTKPFGLASGDASSETLGWDAESSSAPDSAQDPRKQESHDTVHLDSAVCSLKSAYREARLAYRISPERLARVRSTFSRYVGTHSYHNYTVGKRGGDASAKRVIRSFDTAPSPILIHGTEWLSLKVHGQSFMMHQIRKMVSMATLIVRCGTDEGRIQDSFETNVKLSIPKVPGLGLLLERPLFDSYNGKLRFQGEVERAAIGFEPYQAEMDAFKQREIYERIFREEDRDNQFQRLFNAIDTLRSTQLLYLSSLGVDAIGKKSGDLDGGEALARRDLEQVDDGSEGELEAAEG